MNELEAFRASLDALANGGLRQIVLDEALATGLNAEALAKENATTRMVRRTNYLLNSIQGGARPEQAGAVTFLRAGGGEHDVRYAKAQELGATIRPGPGKKFLAIPVGPALTAKGVARYGSPRQVPNLRFQSIRGGSMGLLVQDVKGRNARSTVWFVLVRKVQIRPKYYLFDALYQAKDGQKARLTSAIREHLGVA